MLQVRKDKSTGAGLHGSAAALKAEADRLTAFLKPFLSSFSLSWTPVSSATDTEQRRCRRVRLTPPPPPPSPALIVTRDQRLYGRWYYSPILRSGSASMITFRFRYFARDGRFAQGGESYATFVNQVGDGNWAGMDTLCSKLPPGDRGTWETNHDVLTLILMIRRASNLAITWRGTV